MPVIFGSMSKYRKLSHAIYQCTYHIVWAPKYRYRVLEGQIKALLDRDIRVISSWKDVEIQELNIQPDHIHIVCSIPPKISVSEFMGLLKGKLAIKLFKSYPRLRQKPYWGNHFWTRGYLVNTVGLDEDLVRRYVKYQEKQEREEERQQAKFDLFSSEEPDF